MSGSGGEESDRQAKEPDYGGDHVQFSDGTFHGQVIGKQENHHHHYPAPVNPSADQTPPGVPLSQVRDPFQFEVHRAIDLPGAGLPVLPPYVPRAHDHTLREVVLAAADGTGSRIAALVGGSSTGKTRACWQALGLLRDRPEPWRVWHPIDPSRPGAAVTQLRRVVPYTVVWLNEAQFYLAPDQIGEQVAAGLRELLRDTGRGPVLVLATLWPQYWNTLTTRPGDEAPDPHAQARELLTGHMIAVPDSFTGADLQALPNPGQVDIRLAQAVERAADGQITQYLAGAPILLDRYAQAPPATKALITAAMDARRLGAGPHLPLALLSEAAPGYLTDTQWEQTANTWLQQALDYATTPFNGIPGILTPVKTGAPRNQRDHRATPGVGLHTPVATGVLYRLADYLDQHGRHHRANQIPPIDFWTAARHAHPADLTALGQAARDRGLYRDAAQLLKHATTNGDLDAAIILLQLMHTTHPTDHRPAHLAASRVALDDPGAVAKLLHAMEGEGREEQVAALLARDPASHVALDDPYAVAKLLDVMREDGRGERAAALLARDSTTHGALDDPHSVAGLLQAMPGAGRDEQVVALAERAARHIPLNDPGAVASLLEAMQRHGLSREAVTALDMGVFGSLLHALRGDGREEQVAALMARDPASHAVVDDPYAVASLLYAMHGVGRDEQVAALAERAARHIPLNDPGAVASLLQAMRSTMTRRYAQVTALLARDPASHTVLDDLRAVAALLEAMPWARRPAQVSALAGRAAAHAPLDDLSAVGHLMGTFRWVGQDKQVVVLAERAAAHIAIDHPSAVAGLLYDLRKFGQDELITTLLARDPASHAALGHPGLANLLNGLWEAGAEEQVAVLARRAAAQASLDDPYALANLLEAMRQAGQHEQAAVLAGRAAVHAPLDHPYAMGAVFSAVRWAGRREQVAVLAGRAAVHAPLDHLATVTSLLHFLREVGQDELISTLLARDPAAHVALDDPRALDSLLDALREAGAEEQVRVLIERLPAAGWFYEFLQIGGHRHLYRLGRDPDGQATAPWDWDDLE
ncbi:hypothetical protein [Nonomuraea soli]|uniref:Tetratricopeptide repeat protein n=1 Tax=Nonomuraea soli TaxID=1032476 RepID=A0A7W0CUX5_9ACTN|nr:hypothetical protein [Nonomuraea soli]MBA2897687.1 hypothetical protein [Nonomuraea soli]